MPQRSPIARLGRIALTAFMLVAGLAHARPAAAHAVLLETMPADGAIVSQAPSRVVLRFNEPVSPVALKLFAADGRMLQRPDDISVRDNELTLALPSQLAEGSYLVSYRVISLDSHPVGGSFVFAVGRESAAMTARVGEEGAIDPAWQAAAGIDRVLFYIGLFVAAGGIMFHGLVGGDLARLDKRDRRRLEAAAGVAIIAAALAIGLEGGLLTGGSWQVLFHAGPWRLGADSSLGFSMAVAAAGLGIVFLALRYPKATAFALIGAVLAVASLALTGHAATAAPRWLTGPAPGLHTLAVAFWLGALLPLAASLRRQPAAASAVLLNRFSGRAMIAVAVLVAGGATLATVQVAEPASLLTTGYGQRLLLKLSLVIGLLLLAAINRHRLTPALASGEAAAPRRLGASIAGEALLAVAILAITATLGQSVPPRALLAGEHAHHGGTETGFSVVTFAAGDGALIEVTPARPGRNLVAIHLFGPDGTPLAPKEIAIELANPAAGIEPIRRSLQPVAAGSYRYDGLEINLPGHWQLTVEALVSDFDRRRFEAAVPIR
jgi:copper transport protein